MSSIIETKDCLVRWFIPCLISCSLYIGNAFGQSAGSVVAWGYNISGTTQVPAGLTNVVAISAGGEHSLALLSNGTVVNWGWDTDVPDGLTNVVAISAGTFNSLALKDDGTAVEWDDNTNPPSDLSNVVAIATSTTDGSKPFSLALTGNGTVIGWGDDTYGETSVPSDLTNVVAIAAGADFSVALKADGTVVDWGLETNIPSNVTNIVAIAAGGDDNVALTSEGSVLAWGQIPPFDNVPSGLTNIQAIAVGKELLSPNSFLALASSGATFAWGDNTYGETNIPPGLTNVVAIAAGSQFDLALMANGFPTVLGPVSQSAYSGAPVVMVVDATGAAPLSYQWQFNGTNIPVATMPWLILTNAQLASAGIYSIVVSNALGVVTNSTGSLTVINSLPIITSQPQSLEVPLGDNPSFFVGVTGSLPLSYQWQFNGTNIIGQTNAVLGLSDVQFTNAGNYTLVVSNAFGTVVSSNAALSFVRTSVVAWGLNNAGQCNVPPGLTNVVAVAAGGGYYGFSLALNADGTVVAWGDNGYGECDVPASLTNAVGIAAGLAFSLALNADGTVVAWGLESNVPPNLTNIVAISASYDGSGNDFGMALQGDGTVAVWDYGYNNLTNVPSGLTNVVAIAAGNGYCVALNADQTVIAWGDGSGTNVPAGLTNVVAIGAGVGANDGLAVNADGAVAGWGYVSGNVLVPPGLTNIVAASGNLYFNMALTADHTVVAWGDNTYGECDIPPGLTNVIAISAGQAFGLALDPSGGAITISVGSGGSGQLAYLTAQIGPSEALAAGGAWEATGRGNWSSASNYVAAFTQGQSATVLFKTILGWNTPPSQTLTLKPGQLTVASANYSPVPPEMSVLAGTGVGITGTSNTTYRIQYCTNILNGQWLSLTTNILGPGFNTIVSWPPTNHSSATFYRALWLP